MQLDSPLDAQGQAEENPPVEESSSLALAVLEQSRALTSLVSQLSSGDPLLDVQSTGASTSSKGAQGRERLQKELADRKSEFCLTVMQNAYRRLKPASRAPSSLREIAASDFSMLTYLERFGGYGGAKDMGVMQYALSFILDCAIREDLVGVQEYAALLAVGLEQAAQDQGRWDLAFQLMLLEDPPSQMWSYRGGGCPTDGKGTGLCALMPAEMGYGGFGVFERNRFHTKQATGTWEEAPGSVGAGFTRARAQPEAKEDEVPESKRRRRRRNTASRRCSHLSSVCPPQGQL